MKQGEARLLISQLNYYAQTMMGSVAFVDGMPIDPTAWKSSPFFSSSEDPRRFDTSGSGTDRSLWDSALRIIRLTHHGTVEGQTENGNSLSISPRSLQTHSTSFTIADMRKVLALID